jgi:hypothetical protein
LEVLGVDGKMTLKLILKKGGRSRSGIIWLRIGTSDGVLRVRNEPSDPIK